MAMLSSSDLAVLESLYALSETEKAKEELGIAMLKYLIVFILTIIKNINKLYRPVLFLL